MKKGGDKLTLSITEQKSSTAAHQNSGNNIFGFTNNNNSTAISNNNGSNTSTPTSSYANATFISEFETNTPPTSSHHPTSSIHTGNYHIHHQSPPNSLTIMNTNATTPMSTYLNHSNNNINHTSTASNCSSNHTSTATTPSSSANTTKTSLLNSSSIQPTLNSSSTLSTTSNLSANCNKNETIISAPVPQTKPTTPTLTSTTAEMLINEIFINNIINNNVKASTENHTNGRSEVDSTDTSSTTTHQMSQTPSVGTLLFSTLSEQERQQKQRDAIKQQQSCNNDYNESIHDKQVCFGLLFFFFNVNLILFLFSICYNFYFYYILFYMFHSSLNNVHFV